LISSEIGFTFESKASSMKRLLSVLLTSFIIFSCKKEANNSIEQRCVTVWAAPPWAKNFKPDSLYSLKNITGVIYSKQTPASAHWDTIYNLVVPIRFFRMGMAN